MNEEIKREKTITMTMLMTPDKANFSGKKETSIIKVQNFKKQKSFLVFQQLHQKMI